MGSETVRVRFVGRNDAPDNLRPMIVEPMQVSGDKPIGLLMPIRLR